MRSHLPPSAADKWLECHGWLPATHPLPTQEETVYTAEGTEAHEVFEAALRFDLPPDDLTDNNDMALAVGSVVDWVYNFLEDNPGCKVYLENNVQWGWKPTHSGTADLIIVHDEFLLVLDYKHGKGVEVSVENNPQLLLYLLGVIRRFGLRPRLILGVGQPRIKREVEIWEVNLKSLISFEKRVKKAVHANETGTGERTAGDHCRKFCQAAPTCAAFAEYCLAEAAEEFGATPLGEMTDVEFANALRMVPTVRAWANLIESEGLRRLLDGEEVDGFKLVRKRANRAWGHPETVYATLDEWLEEPDVFAPRSLRSPAQLEKEYRRKAPRLWDVLQSFIVIPEAGYTIAPETDNREAVTRGSEFLTGESDG